MAAKKERTFKGIAASPGVVIGKAFVFDREEDVVIERKINKSEIPKEVIRLEEALIKTRKEILDIQKKIAKGLGAEHAEIFNAHLMVVEDRALIEEVIKHLEKDKKNVEFVFQKTAQKYSKIFSSMEDEYLKERASDIQDVSRRILHNLIGKKREDLSNLTEEVIVIAYDISPSDTALMHKEKVVGFATDIGGRTSHTAILARSLGIPAVVGLHDVSREIASGMKLIVDGNRGLLIINPAKETLKKYGEERVRIERFEEHLTQLKDLPAETRDGYRVTLAANIEMPEDIPSVLFHGSEGVGLYRTEFFYMNRSDLPSEEEHFKAYKKVAEKIGDKSVVIRTLDLGGDKFLSHLQVPREMNPFLGWRAIRFCLERLDIFKVQLRAILRASAYGNLKIMFPMISGIHEIQRAKQVLDEVRQDLKKKKIPYDEKIEVGAMIEIPSAAMIADLLAKEVDFFSIGTNDLIQYSLAVDRVNEKIAYLYEPTHPAVLRLIKMTVNAAHKHGLWVGMCGEMASDPANVLILLGLELDELSISPAMIPEIKKVIRSVSLKETQMLVKEVFNYSSADKIQQKATELLEKVAPELVMK